MPDLYQRSGARVLGVWRLSAAGTAARGDNEQRKRENSRFHVILLDIGTHPFWTHMD
jgi:hypothetical protein